MLTIALEGLDGAGKTTQASMLQAKLDSLKIPNYYLKFPQDPKIRELMMSEPYLNDKKATIFLVLSEYTKVLNSFLEKHEDNRDFVLILDRYELSTKTYQTLHKEGEVKDMYIDFINSLMSWLPVRPNLTIWFEIPIKESLKRVNKRGTSSDPYEKKEMLEKVLMSYRYVMAKGGGTSLVSLNGLKSPEHVHTILMEYLFNGYGMDLYEWSNNGSEIREKDTYEKDVHNFYNKLVRALPEGE